MEIKLAKQLKDAGFPMICVGMFKDYRNILIQRGTRLNRDETVFNFDEDGYLSPNLPELIKACGDGWFRLEKQHDMTKDIDVWVAEHSHSIIRKLCKGIGDTAEIAVANLWLELNKK